MTGGTTGIGRDTAVLFAKSGANVVVAGRHEVEGQETIELIRATGGDGLFVKSDLSNASEVEALVKKTVEEFGRLDVAFNNAGIEGVLAPVIRQSEEDWDRTININLKSVWLCLKYEIRQILTQGGGEAIVNMASIIGLVGSVGAAAYSASKHGVIGLTRRPQRWRTQRTELVSTPCAPDLRDRPWLIGSFAFQRPINTFSVVILSAVSEDQLKSLTR